MTTLSIGGQVWCIGLAVLGTILVSVLKSQLVTSFMAQGLPSAQAHYEASRVSQQSGGSRQGAASAIPHFVQLDFADATRTVLFVMAAVMGLACLVALSGLRRTSAGPVADPA